MIKRVSAILFIMLANIILLAHTVISHHHVKGIPSVVMLLHDHHDDHHDSTKHHDEGQDHDDNEGTERCILKLTFFSPSDSSKSDKCIEHSDKSVTTEAIPSDYERLSVAIQLFLSLSPPPDLNIFYSVFVNQGCGLRAPPIA